MSSTAVPTASNDSSSSGIVPGSSKDVPWYNATAPQISAPMKELLSTYSHVPVDSQVEHAVAIREKAYAIHPYPCLGLWAFLRLHLQVSPLFGSIVEELKTNPDALFVDIGTGLGQEIRSLIAAGVPAERVRGVELEPQFNELGCELFRDGEVVGPSLLVGDILLDEGEQSLAHLRGKVSILHAASFLHLWDWEGQINVACRMVGLMQPRVGVRMLGRQIGSIKAQAKVHETNKNGQTMWKHDPDSFAKMWAEIGAKTGTKWDVTAELGKPYVKMDERTGQWWHDPDTRTIIWSIVRVE